MNFIETLRLKSKLFFIFIIITLGLIIVGVMGAINLNSMKKNLDSLYFGSLVPVIELNKILQTYQGMITNTFYKAKNAQLAPHEIKSQIKTALEAIEKDWKSYESHFKRDYELEYVEYAATEIKEVNYYFYRIFEAIEQESDAKKLLIGNIEKKIAHVHQVINKLITYEVEVAKLERKNFLTLYDTILVKVGSILLMVIFGVMIISFYVFKSIQSDQSTLERTTKKLKIANKKLENVSYTDSLTGLYNRRYFNLVYDKEIKRAKRNHTNITFMMLDIDYFKQYNDMYGHIEGDFALRSVAKVFKDLLKRPSDFIFRLGGEEFGILLTEVTELNSEIIAQAICDAIKARKIKHEGSKIDEFLTVSIGVASCIADEALDDEVLISKADEMLYHAKENGRNKYIITTNISVATPQVAEKASA
ncbi:diguanylate cyclase [Sulfurimonas sp.]|jgi:GGDEF domain-containing protein|uniref:diguanylate cyclase domain-containing protein n=1 Tax=Sulfurimonas sp. TaxID=2022749 RepID=UPI0025FF13B7|nr:diguanylate cyclase [Sulfurimonas sp.]MCK9473904.1 diguanylate cyclase [Sulfurimonas sp.]MDD3506025.1 diguanylate cyclase [Sulfurimonas sp.]